MQSTFKAASTGDTESVLTSFMVYSIYDKLAQEYGPPFCAANDRVAIRNFRKLMSEAPADVFEDFELYFVGWFIHRPPPGEFNERGYFPQSEVLSPSVPRLILVPQEPVK